MLNDQGLVRPLVTAAPLAEMKAAVSFILPPVRKCRRLEQLPYRRAQWRNSRGTLSTSAPHQRDARKAGTDKPSTVLSVRARADGVPSALTPVPSRKPCQHRCAA